LRCAADVDRLGKANSVTVRDRESSILFQAMGRRPKEKGWSGIGRSNLGPDASKGGCIRTSELRLTSKQTHICIKPRTRRQYWFIPNRSVATRRGLVWEVLP